MAEKRQLEFFLLRYVPAAVKEEFVNIGLVMFEPAANGPGFSEVRFTQDWRRVRCLDPDADVEMLEALERDIRVQLADAHGREMLIRKLQDSFSNLVQLSPIKGCLSEEPKEEIELLAKLYFERPKSSQPGRIWGRESILHNMRVAFEQAGVWKLLLHGVPVSSYTKEGDSFRLDFGYHVGDTVKFFHAVSLKKGMDQAVHLSYRYPKIEAAMPKLKNAYPFLTAVVDDGLDRENEQVRFALGMMEEARIKIAACAEMPAIAEAARLELRA